MKLGNLKRTDIREVVVPFDDPLTIKFDRNKITADFEDGMMSLYEKKRGMGATAKMLSEVIIDWDLSDETKPYSKDRENDPSLPEIPDSNTHIFDETTNEYYPKVEPTEEFIRTLGPDPIEMIADAIGDETNPKKKTSAPIKNF